MKKISVIIPVYNQETIIACNVPKIISVMDHYGAPYEILLINDGSTDSSGQQLSQLNYPKIRIITKENQGLGSVFKLGFLQATGNILILLDLDLSYGIDNIHKVIDLSNEWDCVVCSKYLGNNAYPFHRKILSFCHYLFCKRIFNISIRDMGSGIVMVHSNLVQNEQFICNGFGIHCEFYLMLNKKKPPYWKFPFSTPIIQALTACFSIVSKPSRNC
ncbi:MAG: dolichol-phosphate mannosyltransferase [Candidatus Magnetoglobus multicellularis str. Araruama]|uniref:Dolichol-phosphate mannosyltransferase n=1 Tax=Candidatus Magnetoglobus multicellularis str. Araruama TaxID=890399 RepID=A0A1V1PHR9_9BACT|nr:MAG: dolichol-phosphate mannosyltransferase [Candidatus Magnetoglobus multicellularis str. Araruama]